MQHYQASARFVGANCSDLTVHPPDGKLDEQSQVRQAVELLGAQINTGKLLLADKQSAIRHQEDEYQRAAILRSEAEKEMHIAVMSRSQLMPDHRAG